MLIEEIGRKIEGNRFEFSKHAVDQSIILVSVFKNYERSLAMLK